MSGALGTLLLVLTRGSWIFDLTPLGTRFFSALYGSLIPIFMFFFVKSILLFKKNSTKRLTALTACFLSAFLPWSFMMSRLEYTQIPLIIILVCFHLYFLLQSSKTSDYFVSLIPIALGVILYPSMIIIFPISFFITFFCSLDSQSNNQKYISWIVFVTFAVIIGIAGSIKFHIFDSRYRGLDLAIWNDVNVTADSNYYRGLSRLSSPSILSANKDTEIISNRVLFNKPVSVIQIFTKNYLSFFSPDFLFLKGDNILRHSTGMVGEFFPFLLPFMVYGTFVFFSQADKKHKTIFLVWILASPIPAAITKDGATYLLRVITLMPFLTYFCALGLVSSFELLKNKYAKITYGVLITTIALFSIYRFLFGYFHVYPALSAPHWEYGFKELSDFQSTHSGKLLTIWEDKYPVWYFCFWQNLPKEICDLKLINNFESVNGSRIDLPINNLLFSLPANETDLMLITDKYKPDFIAIPAKYSPLFPKFTKEHQAVETVKYPDQTVAFSIYKLH